MTWWLWLLAFVVFFVGFGFALSHALRFDDWDDEQDGYL